MQVSVSLRSSFFGVERALCLEIALGAHAHVLHIVFQIDGHLLALKDESAVHLAAIADGLAAAGADGFHFLDGVGQLQQPGGAGEALEGEICPQAVADHRDVQVHRDHEQLLGLLRGEELALVAQHAGKGSGAVGLTHRLEHIRFRRDQQIGLAAPQVTYIMNDLKNAGFAVDVNAITVEEARQSILKNLQGIHGKA